MITQCSSKNRIDSKNNYLKAKIWFSISVHSINLTNFVKQCINKVGPILQKVVSTSLDTKDVKLKDFYAHKKSSSKPQHSIDTIMLQQNIKNRHNNATYKSRITMKYGIQKSTKRKLFH